MEERFGKSDDFPFDTDTCVEIFRGNKKVMERWNNQEEGGAVSFMTPAELYYGTENSQNRGKHFAAIEKFLRAFDVIESSPEIAKR